MNLGKLCSSRQPSGSSELGLNDESEVQEERRYCWSKLSKKQFLIGCGVSSIIIFVSIILLLIFVGGESVAQGALDKAIMDIDEMVVNGDRIEGGKLILDTTMSLEAFNTNVIDASLGDTTADLYYQGQKFGQTDVKAMTLPASSSLKLTMDTEMIVSNRAVFNQFGRDLMRKKSVPLRMVAKVDVSTPVLPTLTGLKFDKVLPIAGFNSFIDPPVEIVSMDFIQGGDSERFRSNPSLYKNSVWSLSKARLPNVSSVRVGNIGKFTLNIWSQEEDGVWLGKAWALHDVSIQGGENNELDMEVMLQLSAGTMDDKGKARPDNSAALRQMFGRFTAGEPTMLYLKGETTTNQAWEDSIKALTIGVSLDGLTDLQDKMFVYMTSMIDASFDTLRNDAHWKKGEAYCSPLVSSFTPDTMKTGLPLLVGAWASRFLKAECVAKNPMGMGIVMRDYRFDIDLEVPDPEHPSGFRAHEFGVVTSDYPGQEVIEMGPFATSMVSMMFCLKPMLMEAGGGLLPKAGAAVSLMHLTGFDSFATAFNSSGVGALKSLSTPGLPPLGIALVPSKGEEVVPMLVTVRGKATICHEDTGFCLDEIPLAQEKVGTLFRYFNTLPDFGSSTGRTLNGLIKRAFDMWPTVKKLLNNIS